ncbi:MAG: hypothetical protein Q7S53_03565 [bacterium]|nr:hypothetical protein [bacterium]
MKKSEKFLVVVGVLFVVAFTFSAVLNYLDYKLKKEGYITTLFQTYTSNVEACREAVNKANEKASDQEKKDAVKKTCIDEINNNSREAKLLKNWGQSSLLSKE